MKSQWCIDNEERLKEINATLRPEGKKNGKIGIFLFGQNGDIMTAMSVLKYMDALWPEKEIIWFCNLPNADAFKYSPISEVRPYPWAGNGLPEGYENFYPMLCTSDNKLSDRKYEFDLTKDLEDGYFPAPHMLSAEQRHGFDYPNISRKIFGVDPSLEWHPYLSFSEEEIQTAFQFISLLPQRRTIMLETFCGSGQSSWDDEMTKRTIELCRKYWGGCNFIFASHPDNSRFFDDEGMVSASQFTVRQTALLNDYCDLFIGVSSGISVATSAWGLKPVPKIQFCGSFTCSTVSLANGPIDLITMENKTPRQARFEFEDKLKEVLKKIK